MIDCQPSRCISGAFSASGSKTSVMCVWSPYYRTLSKQYLKAA